ncbi:MAG: hypothetical protein COA79_18235 [Planctomycetota bacterium]|nr:MAG: hypothetical protein COA79_18235 [Planctomycetota bacterium]
MTKILIHVSQDNDGVIDVKVASLISSALSSGNETIGVTTKIITDDALKLLGEWGLSKCYAPESSLESIKAKSAFISSAIKKEEAQIILFVGEKSLCSYIAGSNNGTAVDNVFDLKIESGEVETSCEIYAGKFILREKSKDGIICISTVGLSTENSSASTACLKETLSYEDSAGAKAVGDFIPSKKEEGIALPDAEVVLDVGDGLGTKGISTVKKLCSILGVMGVKVAIGASRVVTDGGRMPRNTQIGISGISVQPELIISMGVSGAPQHWAGMKNAKQKVCVNTDKEAPLMKMVDMPIEGDAHVFLKDLIDIASESLTDEQKEKLKKTPTTKKVKIESSGPAVQEHHEPLPDQPLNIDLRGIYFELFEVYQADHNNDNWNQEKIKALLSKAANYAEKFVNQGKRDAEVTGILFRPGEEFKEQAIIAPESYHTGWKEYYKAGFGRMSTPKHLGGLEVPESVQDYISEIISAGSPAMGTYFGLTQGAALIMSTFGGDWMKEKVLPRLMDGTDQGTMCLTEAQAGSDLAAVTTSAKRMKDSDLFEISGTKIFITSGDHDITENHWHIVLAKIEGTGLKGTKAISLFLVPKFWTDEDCGIEGFNEVATQSIEHKSGMMTSPTCVLKFSNSKGYLIGDNVDEECRQPSGMPKMFFFMNAMRHETGTAGRGQAVATCLDALIYSTERKQGVAFKEMGQGIDQSLIIKHANQKAHLLDMFARTFADRALTQKLTQIRDHYHKKHHDGMIQYDEKMAELNIESESLKILEELAEKLTKVVRQLSKSKSAKKKLKKSPEGLEQLKKEIINLKVLKNTLRDEINSINNRFLDLYDLKNYLKSNSADQETYASLFTSLVKAQVTDDNMKTLLEGMQAYGGIGFMAETPVTQRFHDSPILNIWEGTNDIQSLNTVFRQIDDDTKDSKGDIMFLKFIDEITKFMDDNREHPRLGASIEILRKYCSELLIFRNAMVVSTLKDKIRFWVSSHGYKLSPSKKDKIIAKIKWAERMQAVCRDFNTWFSQSVQAWQIIRVGIRASECLDQLKNDANIDFDKELYDEAFLEGRVMLANHFVRSPNCLNKGLYFWKDAFNNDAPVDMVYENLADSPSRVTMG